ncbi:MAG TPA: hypothetical protein P5560_10495 [Thermotogota bacterium]|nr:hypothetical protein [Thermotogota bacterium]HRW93365.1 hypothetical protein [Thermotogota bacterium]
MGELIGGLILLGIGAVIGNDKSRKKIVETFISSEETTQTQAQNSLPPGLEDKLQQLLEKVYQQELELSYLRGQLDGQKQVRVLEKD